MASPPRRAGARRDRPAGPARPSPSRYWPRRDRRGRPWRRRLATVRGPGPPPLRAVILPTMPYPKKLLNDYEELAVDLHPHWWYFAEAVCALVVSIALGIFLVAVGAADWLKWVAVVLIVLSALWTLVRYCKWLTTN